MYNRHPGHRALCQPWRSSMGWLGALFCQNKCQTCIFFEHGVFLDVFCVEFIMSLQSSELVRDMMLMKQSFLCDMVFETPGVEEWLRLHAEDMSDVSEWGLSAALHILKVCSFLNVLYNYVYSQYVPQFKAIVKLILSLNIIFFRRDARTRISRQISTITWSRF